jgi:hypothetical protein
MPRRPRQSRLTDQFIRNKVSYKDRFKVAS